MKTTEFTFESRDQKTQIHALRWEPEDGNVKAVLQLVHGMAEHIERYAEFAEYMTKLGFAVTANDHLGHGGSIGEDGAKGYFCERDAATVVVRDVHRLKKMTQELYPGVPYFIMGHSMGSFITRNYICRYGKGIQGAVIMGTGMQPAALLAVSKGLASVQGLFCGQKHPSKFIDKAAFGSYNKRIENARTPFDWLTKEKDRVDAYMEDPFCGFLFTVNGFKTLFTFISDMTASKNVEQIPKTLPLFLVAGEEDPVGNYGQAVTASCEFYKKLGVEDVSMKLYPSDRHELLNETDRDQVMKDVSEWLLSKIG